MSFEMAGLSYDSSRKQNTNIKNFAGTPPSGVIAQYNPVPYNFDFNLYIYVRNIEDGTQIIEHILPFFTPDYTIKLNLIPEMGIIKEIPVILNSTSHEITYEGGRENETRMIIWTLNFTVKGFVFGKTTETGVINRAFVSVYNLITDSDVVEFYLNLNSGFGTYKVGDKDETEHGLPGLSGNGKWTIREKQAGNKSSRTVMFQPDGKKGLNKSHVNLDDDTHLSEFKKTLGHIEMEKARKEFHAARKETPKNTSTTTKNTTGNIELSTEPSHITIHGGQTNKKVRVK